MIPVQAIDEGIKDNAEGRLLKQAERYQQSGTPLEKIQQLITSEAQAQGVDISVVENVMRRVQNVDTNTSHGALGKAHNPVGRLAAIVGRLGKYGN